MDEAPENGKESQHSAHAKGMDECNQQKTLSELINPPPQYPKEVSHTILS